jgi:putative ABC transport system permease protein
MGGGGGRRERWYGLLRRGTPREIEDELSFHLEMRARELEAEGEAPDRARERALARFGDVAAIRARCGEIARRRERRMARTRRLAELWQDLRFAARTLTRSPGFSAVAILTLVLGIGANSAIFSVVNGVLLRPLPFPSPERVYHWGWDWGAGRPGGSLSAYKLAYFRDRSESYEAVATYRGFRPGLGRGADAVGVGALRISPGFLDVVGYRPVRGRAFSPEEEAPGGPLVALVGHDLWRTRLGGDPEVVGREIVLDDASYTVVGVLPAAFRFPQAPPYTDVLIPLRLQPDVRDEGHNWAALVRLAPGVDRAEAEAELAVLSEGFRSDHPDLVGEREAGMRLTTYQAVHVGDLGPTLWILLGAVGLVLLIACANVANLLLVRTEDRQRELAVRSAVGAGRGRLIRQILAESLLLAGIAGALGLAVGAVATRLLVGAVPVDLPRSGDISLDVRVVLFTFSTAVVTAALFGLAAAIPSSGRSAQALREGGRGAPGGRWLRSALVAGEAALSVVLLVGAGLLIATLVQLRAVDPGFATDDLLTASLPRWTETYGDGAAIVELERRLLPALERSPGILGAATSSNVPLERGWNLPIEIEGRPDAWEGDVEWRAVSPGYFETLGIPILRGRTLTETDGAGSPRVAVVNASFANHYFPDSDPIGQRVAIGRYKGNWIGPAFAGEAATIVGVVADVREMALKRDPKRTVAVPRSQAAMPVPPVFLLRTVGPDGARAAAESLREVLRELDPALPPPSFQSMDEVVRESVAAERFNALLMSGFAFLALFLTAVGIYGVVSYGARRRTREIGIRIALGAGAAEVTRLVTRQGVRPVLAGLAIGGLGAVAVARLLQGMIWGVSPGDPVTLALVALLLAAVASVASWLPARRAARSDPVASLRYD